MATLTTERPRCPKCDSARVYYRTKTHDFVCQTCGHDWPKPEAKE